MPRDFYDALAPFFHLVYADWDASIVRQGAELDGVIREHWGESIREVLDAACGVGTQALGLAGLGYDVTASDLSPGALERARREADSRKRTIRFSVADLRTLAADHGRAFDLVLACDNVVPHLLSDGEILEAFRQMFRCVRPGGGCIISVRDYAALDPHPVRVVPYGVRREGGARYLVFQVWEFQGAIYDLHMYLVEDRDGGECRTHVMRTRYYAVTIEHLMDLMRKAGFANVLRLDGRFFQPLLIAQREPGS